MDESYLDRIITTADLAPTDSVLEIGPGLGALTRRLAQSAGNVVAVELDDRLIEVLRAEFANEPHVSIVHADILKASLRSLMSQPAAGQPANARLAPTAPPLLDDAKVSDARVSHTAKGKNTDVPEFAEGQEHSSKQEHDETPRQTEAQAHRPYKVVANLPYYITNAVLRYLLEAETPPTSAVVMVQKEVAERVCAAPGKLSLLAVSVQFYAKPTLAHRVPAGAFYPRPKVDSAVLHLDIFPKPALEHVEPKKFFRIVKAGFSQKRKQLLNSLSAGLGQPKDHVSTVLTQTGIDPKRRAETLSIPEWGRVYDSLQIK